MMKVLITGGSQGIGLAIAKELHVSGHELFLVARDSERLNNAIESFSGRANGFACDLGKAGQIDSLIEKTKQENFYPDVIVLNAAAFGNSIRSVIKPSGDELRELLEINVISNYQLVQGFIDTIRKGVYPRIIIIGSTASIRVDDGSLYGISKWALRSYTYSLRNELKNLGVGVTLLNPGGTFTEKRVPDENTSKDRLLEASDIGKLVAALLTLSSQAVVEEINIRPLLGDTY
jgi:short-subunit dehydrogenase